MEDLKAPGKYHGRMVKAPINDWKPFPAEFQWRDPEGTEWYLVNGLRVSGKEMEPYLVK